MFLDRGMQREKKKPAENLYTVVETFKKYSTPHTLLNYTQGSESEYHIENPPQLWTEGV